MGLGIVAGCLAGMVRNGEDEGAAHFDASQAVVNRFLAGQGLPVHALFAPWEAARISLAEGDAVVSC